MTTTKAIARLLEWTPLVLDAVLRSRQRCIFATRVGIDVLAAFGIDAEPRPVVACVANSSYVLWKEEDRTRPTPPDAWAVWAGLPALPDDPIQDTPGWNGHLVVYVPRLSSVLDLDFQQFRRPLKLLDTPPSIVAEWPREQPFAHYVARDACRRLYAVRYEHNPTNLGYTVSTDWRRERPVIHETVSTLVRLIRKGSP